jgi:hypothetical protein
MGLNNITGNVYSDEWYTDLNTVQKAVGLLNPHKQATICCPFDSEKSRFVIWLKQMGFNVLYGMNDWLEADYEYDYLITNPPFSIKDKVIEKVLISGKPSVLILPLDSLGGVKRRNLFKTYGFPIVYVPERRVQYFDENWNLRKGASFHTVILKFNEIELDQNAIIWE